MQFDERAVGHVLCCADHDRTLCDATGTATPNGVCRDCLRLSFTDGCPLGKECHG